MRLLLDNNLSPRLADRLRAVGHELVHVRDLGLQAAPDAAVMQAAQDDSRVVVSADTDFGTLLARSGASAPSLVLIRTVSGRRVDALAGLLTVNLEATADDLHAGAVIVLTDSEVRIRSLPLPPGH